MLTRREVEQKRSKIYEELYKEYAEGKLAPGYMLPPVRVIAEAHGVSPKMVWQAIQRLVDEGILYTIDRKGTFVGKPQQEFAVYIMTTLADPLFAHFTRLAFMGFEERIAQLGGVSLRLRESEARERAKTNDLPPLSGVFHLGGDPLPSAWWPEGVPSVEYGQWKTGPVPSDRVYFDDVSAGRQAAQHLIAMGHRNIAFLAMHSPEQGEAAFSWSVGRQRGWEQSMAQAGISTESLALYPRLTGFHGEGFQQFERAKELAREQIVPRRDLTAIIAVNVIAAEALYKALDEADVAPEMRPAVVCFDESTNDARAVVSYLRLPWEELGRAAAQMLWERKTGTLVGEPVQRYVSMRLIQRLTCRPEHSMGWANQLLTTPLASTS